MRGGYTNQSEFPLEVGKDYIILGLGLFKTVLDVLVWDESDRPNWTPVGLFDIQRQTMPSHWQFAVLDSQAASGGPAGYGWLARWGYPRLVDGDSHSDGLMERDVDEMQFCFRELVSRREHFSAMSEEETTL